jgi:hypothetical protein
VFDVGIEWLRVKPFMQSNYLIRGNALKRLDERGV